jgi:hypothetical protein
MTTHPTIAGFVAACQADPRVLAAFLGGSYATGRADAHSDLDLYVVVDDEAFDTFMAERAAFVGQLGEVLFLENFTDQGFDLLFFTLADGTDGELGLGRASDFGRIHGGPHRVLLDKTGILAGVTFPLHAPDPADQRETLRGQLVWFWHDVAHLAKALARGNLWAAQGNLHTLRLVCIQLARLGHDFGAAAVGYEKLDQAVPAAALEPLRDTFVPLDRDAILRAGHRVVELYRTLAPPLAAAHDLPYPERLDRLISARLPPA